MLHLCTTSCAECLANENILYNVYKILRNKLFFRYNSKTVQRKIRKLSLNNNKNKVNLNI